MPKRNLGWQEKNPLLEDTQSVSTQSLQHVNSPFPFPLSHDPGFIGLPKFKSVLEPGWPPCTHQRPRPGWSATLRPE